MINYSTIRHNLVNILGWKTNRKIVVIESDDWGSIRMNSAKTIKRLEKSGVRINDPYNLNDSLASEEDLTRLFETLSSVKDKNGNPVILTANTVVANPDFKKIEESDFNEFHYEVFTDTLKKYPEHLNSFNLWKKGIMYKVFHPQYHGREHVNIFRWLKSLQNDDKKARIAFHNKVFGLKPNDLQNSYMRALDYEGQDQFKIIEMSLTEGLGIFKKQFGYHSKSFIAPSYVWDSQVEKVLHTQGVKYLQGIQYQYYPKEGRGELQKKFNYTGKMNKFSQRYLVRNAFFEPTITGTNQAVENALKRIDIAFKWKKPAIIGSHRLNYIGYINQENRDKNLKILKILINRILKKWPDVEFMTSDELGDLMIENN